MMKEKQTTLGLLIQITGTALKSKKMQEDKDPEIMMKKNSSKIQITGMDLKIQIFDDEEKPMSKE